MGASPAAIDRYKFLFRTIMHQRRCALKRRIVPVAVLILLLSVSVYTAAKSQHKQVASDVDQFFEFHFSHAMGFTPEAVKQRIRWLTPQMIEACSAYFAIPQDPNEPPVINGDPFTGTQ